MAARVVTFDTPSLGDRSYLVTDGEVAVVVDPQRDVERFLTAAEQQGLTITHVAETHIHNDYVSGGWDLARRTGAEYLLPAGDGAAVAHRGVRDGDVVEAGTLRVEVVHTPGHTPHHLSYVVANGDAPTGVFTGGSMLYGTVGRTDLISAELTDRLTRDQYRSVRHLAERLADSVPVHPTHGFGSHCSAGEPTRTASTIGLEREDNPALVLTSEDDFVRAIVAGFHPYPAYYAHMAALNRSGPAPLEPSPLPHADAPALTAALARGEWVVDLRDRRAFAAGHLCGEVNVELRNDLATYLGWVIPWGTPFTLLGDTAQDVAEARTMLARIGLDAPAGMATADALGEAPLHHYEVGTFADLRAARSAGGDDIVVVDVRDTWEFDSGHHPAAQHIPFHELSRRHPEIPAGQVWVYCATGARAAVAASQLAAAGRRAVLVDDFCLPGDAPQ